MPAQHALLALVQGRLARTGAGAFDRARTGAFAAAGATAALTLAGVEPVAELAANGVIQPGQRLAGFALLDEAEVSGVEVLFDLGDLHLVEVRPARRLLGPGLGLLVRLA